MGFLSELIKDLTNLEAFKKTERVWSIAFEDPGGDVQYNRELRERRDSEEEQEDDPDQ